VRRGIYRLVYFPASEHEDLVVLWLWAEQAGVFSHATALALYDLSGVLPFKVHMTIPENWQRRRLRVPAGLVLHYANLSDVERAWFSAVPVTTPRRTPRVTALV
jgi:predicted transcriptional regulator of viral defense system